MLEARQLTMRYGAFQALSGVSFQAPRGAITALIGPNGAGKTTTIHLVTGAFPPTTGEVFLFGERLTRDHLALRRRIGYVPDRPDVYERLTCAEYVRFVCGLYGMRAAEADRAAAPLLERFGLAGKEGELLGAYSHGMRQKAVLVATLAHDPEFLVLDEPLVGLDPTSAKILEEVVLERARAGAIVLFSTHLLDLAERVADRVVMIGRGIVRAEGALDDLLGASDGSLSSLYFRLTATEAA